MSHESERGSNSSEDFIEQHDEFKIPQTPESSLVVDLYPSKIRGDMYEEARYLEVHHLDLAASLMKLGTTLLSHSSDERMVLRWNNGNEKKLNFMDGIFAPSVEKQWKQPMVLKYLSKDRDLYMHSANYYGIGPEELSVRLFNVGLYALRQQRGQGVKIYHYQGNEISEYKIEPTSIKPRILKSMEEFNKSNNNPF